MKLAIVVPGGVDRSGEYRVIPSVLALIRRLARTNEVHVFALAQEPKPARWELAGAQIHNIGHRHTRWRAVAAIVAEHRRSRFALVQAIWSGACGQIAVSAACLLRLPSCVHVAGGELVALRDIHYGGRLHWYGRLAEAVVLRLASTVTAASQPMVDSIAALGIEAELVPLGVDLDTWPPRAPVRRDVNLPARLLHVASLNRVKDQTTLFKALAILRDSGVAFSLDAVGEDTLNGEIQALARQLGIAQQVAFHGFLTHGQLRPLMEAADLLVMSSRHEAGPIVMLEAAIVGVPTVGTAVGHIAEWAPEAAVAVPVGDSESLAMAIGRVLGDEPTRLELAKSAQQRAIAIEGAFMNDEIAAAFRLQRTQAPSA
jgi:glycosyltransferase involved in cell wall biosynthesis